jgi:trk system potassium uptake protein TrkH
LLPYITDFHNPVYDDLNRWQVFMANFFQSVSTRTAGFNTIDIGALSPFVLMVYIVFMYIGANPAGTG